jgi:hypothetical protein
MGGVGFTVNVDVIVMGASGDPATYLPDVIPLLKQNLNCEQNLIKF